MKLLTACLATLASFLPNLRADDATAEAFAAARQQIELIHSLSVEATVRAESRGVVQELRAVYHREGTSESLLLTSKEGSQTWVRIGERAALVTKQSCQINSYDPQLRSVNHTDIWTLFGFRKLEELFTRYDSLNVTDPFRRYERVADADQATVVAANDYKMGAGGKKRREYVFDRTKGNLCVRMTETLIPAELVRRQTLVLEDVRQAQAGLYLPYKTTYTNTDEKAGRVDQRVVVTVTSLAVNKPVPADAFKVPYRRGLHVTDIARGVEFDCDDRGEPITPVVPIRKPALRPAKP